MGGWIKPVATVLASNIVFMMIELAGARVAAREFGASLYTWTSIIGVMLGGITFGNYLGGRLSDRVSPVRAIAWVFLLASIATLLGPFISLNISWLFMHNVAAMELSWPAQITLFIAGTFFVPCMFIGMVSPLVIRRALLEGHAPGRTVGIIYAWGAVGGIAGTFFAGYFLIAWVGSMAVIALSALALAAVSTAYARTRWVSLGWGIVCGALLITILLPSNKSGLLPILTGFRPYPDSRMLFETESQYSYIAVQKDREHPTVRQMILDKLMHSQVDLTDPRNLMYEYEWIYEAVINKVFPERPLRALLIGGGGFVFPHYLEVTRPGSLVEVAEIDPAVTETAHAWFGFPRDTAVKVFNMDARNRVADLIRANAGASPTTRFECIFGDSFNDYSVPYHLTTLEFMQEVNSLLSDDGIYMMNMIDMFSSGQFLSAVVKTCGEVFPFLYVLNTGAPPTVRDTFVVICAKQPINIQDVAKRVSAAHDYHGGIVDPAALEQLAARIDAVLLTDDYAPVENMLAPVVRTRHKDVGTVLLQQAEKYQAQGALDKAIASCRQALDAHPEWPEALDFLAKLLLEKGDRAGAMEIWKQVVTLQPELTSVHDQLARLALAANDADTAIEQWKIAVSQTPSAMAPQYNLGLAYASKQQYREAIVCWQNVLKYDPAHQDSLQNLVLACAVTGQYDLAWECVRKLRALGAEPDGDKLRTLVSKSGRGAP